MNKQKDRLVELFEQLEDPSSTCPRFGTNKVCEGCKYLKGDGCDLTARFIDYLLANGVIVPPVKVGQTVYETILMKDGTGSIVEREVAGFHFGDFPKLRGHKRRQYLIVYHDATNSITHIDIDRIGKTVFLTKEEAEAKLKEGVQE